MLYGIQLDMYKALSIHKIRQNTKMPTFYKTLYLYSWNYTWFWQKNSGNGIGNEPFTNNGNGGNGGIAILGSANGGNANGASSGGNGGIAVGKGSNANNGGVAVNGGITGAGCNVANGQLCVIVSEDNTAVTTSDMLSGTHGQSIHDFH